ncbi:MAG: hypothetical protein RJQ09_03025 [Cyclobacteriaceae bacterium]
MKQFCFSAILWLFYITCNAQYDNSAGLRLGYTPAVTFKKFVHDEEAIELFISGRKSGVQLTGIYQFHKPLETSFTDRLYLNYGVGGHFGFESRRRYRRFTNSQDQNEVVVKKKGQFAMGVDAIIGLEYRWLSVPMTIGFDVKPHFTYIGMRSTRLRFWDTALSFKYIF